MVAFRIALRYLFSRKSHNAVNVISIIAVLGVAVATTAIVCVLSVFNGFSDLATSRLSKIDPQIKVTAATGKVIHNADSLRDVIQSISSVEMAVSTLEENALLIVNGSQTAITLRGVEQEYDRVTKMDSIVIDGEFIVDDTTWPLASVSIGVASRANAYAGMEEAIKVFVPRRQGRINPASPMNAFRVDSLWISSVFRSDDEKLDLNTVIVPIERARNLLDYNEAEATSIDIALKPGAAEQAAIQEIRSILGPDYKVMNRLEQEQQSFRMIAVEKWITFLMLAFILIIASFNVLSSLSMLIIEKQNNMSTLRAIGAEPRMIRSIFFWDGWLISVVGGVLGIVIGTILCLAQQIGGFIKLSGDPMQLAVSVYPVRVAPADILVVAALIVVVGLVIGWITSRMVNR